MDDVSVVMRDVWGTWEELILGGAVLRHGTGDWDVISSELRTRSVHPYYFTPEACRARYVELQQRYMGCKYWYNELRERRVAELKCALEKFEVSIRFLVSKLETLKGEKRNFDQNDYDSSHTESPPQSLPKTKGFKIKTNRIKKSKNEFELSAGSFTQDLEMNPQPKSHTPSSLESNQDIDLKIDIPESCMNTIVEKGCTVRKRRGKRKRKDGSWDMKENEHLGSKTSGCDQSMLSSSADMQDGESCRGPQCDDLVEIFNSVTENKYALVFRHRLDSQKRARYRKTIKQHMDLDTLRSRIANNCIKSTGELFKDLLLLANNALVFYSKRTREYKSAMILREIVTKRYKQLCNDSNSRSLSSILCFSSMSSPPVRPRSVRPRAPCKQSKLVVKFPSGGPMAGPHGYLKLNHNSDSIPEIEGIRNLNVDFIGSVDPKIVKRGSGRPRRVGGGGRGGKQPPPPPPPPKNCTNRKKAHKK